LLGIIVIALGYGIGAAAHFLSAETLATIKRVLPWTL
jgi:hypothetical protein